MEPRDLTLTQASTEIAAGRLTPVELTDSVIQQIEAHEPQIGAFATLTLDVARQAASQAQEEIAKSGPRTPLHGIPLGIKDLCDTKGVLSTSSSQTRAGRIAESDSASGCARPERF